MRVYVPCVCVCAVCVCVCVCRCHSGACALHDSLHCTCPAWHARLTRQVRAMRWKQGKRERTFLVHSLPPLSSSHTGTHTRAHTHTHTPLHSQHAPWTARMALRQRTPASLVLWGRPSRSSSKVGRRSARVGANTCSAPSLAFPTHTHTPPAAAQSASVRLRPRRRRWQRAPTRTATPLRPCQTTLRCGTDGSRGRQRLGPPPRPSPRAPPAFAGAGPQPCAPQEHGARCPLQEAQGAARRLSSLLALASLFLRPALLLRLARAVPCVARAALPVARPPLLPLLPLRLRRCCCAAPPCPSLMGRLVNRRK